MPRSLSSRCHTQHPLQKPFCSLQHHDEAVLQMPRAFHWRSLQRHQPLKPPRSKIKPFPSYGRWKMKQKEQLAGNCRSFSVTGWEGRRRQPDSWHLRRPPNGWTAPVLVAMVMYSTPPSSSPDQITPSWHTAEGNTFNFWSLLSDTATAKEESEVQDEAISLWAHETWKVCYTFIAINTACFDLIQLSCLHTGMC